MTGTVAPEARRPTPLRVDPGARVPAARVGIVSVGAPVVRLFADQPRIASVAGAGTDEDLDLLLTLLRRLTTKGGYVVVPFSDSLPAAEARRLAMVRAMVGTHRVALSPLPLPPLGVGVVTAATASVLGRLRYPGAVPAVLEQLSGMVRGFTWLPTLSGLRQPAPTFSQRLRSRLPGGAWVVTHDFVPQLTWVSQRRPSIPMPVMRQPLGLVTTAPDNWWVSGYLFPGLGQPPVTVVHDETAQPGRGAAQAVIYPCRLADETVRLAQGLGERACAWCGELIASPQCPFCRTHEIPGRVGPRRRA